MLASGHQEAVRDTRWNMNNIAGGERMHFAAGERSPDIFTRLRAPLLSGHRPAQHECTFAAVHHNDVDDLVMFFRETVSVPIKQAESVIAVIGERLTRGMVQCDIL